MVLASKGGIRPPLPYDQSYDYLTQATDASLVRLRTDVIELYHIHRPDILADPQEVARALEYAVGAGIIRALGGGRLLAPQSPRDRAVAAALDLVAEAECVSRSAAAYGWLMAHRECLKRVSCIPNTV